LKSLANSAARSVAHPLPNPLPEISQRAIKMTNNTRAIEALRQIMLDDSDTVSIVRQIEACEQLLEFESPPDIVE
jgi:hypothetical protein